MSSTTTRRAVLVGAAATAAAFHAGTGTAEEAATHDIRITEFVFVPDHLEVRVGDKIRWTNEDLASHTATADEFGWDTGELQKDQSGEITVTADMETSYFCIFHQHMKAKLTII